MIIKSSNFLYLFDFDGTIAGNDNWFGFFKNCKLSFQQLHINPSDFDIRWGILTSRPRMDRWFIKMVCLFHGLSPNQIITAPTFRWKFKSFNEEIQHKELILKSILDEQFETTVTGSKIDRICYIDNDDKSTIYLNQNRDTYQYIALSVGEFVNPTQDYNIIL